jgi:hypothetical protein
MRGGRKMEILTVESSTITDLKQVLKEREVDTKQQLRITANMG